MNVFIVIFLHLRKNMISMMLPRKHISRAQFYKRDEEDDEPINNRLLTSFLLLFPPHHYLCLSLSLCNYRVNKKMYI